MKTKIYDFLSKHNYLFEVEEIENGYIIITPERKLDYHCPSMISEYYIVNQNGPGIKVVYDGEENVFNMPKYAIRLAIRLEVLRACEVLEYSEKLIAYVDISQQRVENLDFGSKINYTEIERFKAEKLEEIFMQELYANPPFSNNVSEKLSLFGIEEGFTFLKKLFYGE